MKINGTPVKRRTAWNQEDDLVSLGSDDDDCDDSEAEAGEQGENKSSRGLPPDRAGGELAPPPALHGTSRADATLSPALVSRSFLRMAPTAATRPKPGK